jgi:hypothetical protein
MTGLVTFRELENTIERAIVLGSGEMAIAQAA